MLDEDDLGPADKVILDMLNEGRVTAPLVADEADYSLQYVRDRLNRLVEHGNAEKIYEGLYELVEDPRDVETGSDSGGILGDNDSNSVGSPIEQQVEQRLQTVDITGRGSETQEIRREAIRFAWETLRDRGEATTQDLANAAFDEYGDHSKFGYSASENHYRGYTFWDSCAREVLKELPGVEPPPQRGNSWRFVGSDDQ